jgi:hypothetical protein
VKLEVLKEAIQGEVLLFYRVNAYEWKQGDKENQRINHFYLPFIIV